MAEHVFDVSDQEFDEKVLQNDKPVVVDFWAPWCGPCRSISPIIEELAGEYGGQVEVAKVNVDDNPESPGRYGVWGIPTIIMFKNGEVVDQVVGASPDKVKQLFETGVAA